ncbi:MAG: hypothetical protein Hyperionvirus24_30 [Hyperionvirus sp.]|uniref:Uncharacterized protein n=1 Tax=Hyperionvirus sp. TaxID=2487770 RepID=A0A3G5AAZ3_9VIRU|nr:MAG: hypothetical protein Hyperionvirus24_30 [Hyperionvirus sp.]
MALLPTSIGEGLDKLTILEIKFKLVEDDYKKKEIQKEIEHILPILEKYKSDAIFFYKCLYVTNYKLWLLCDKVRVKNKCVEEYADLYDNITQENDNRFRIKYKINLLLDSTLKEQKGYVPQRAMICPDLNLREVFSLIGAIRFLSIKYDELRLCCATGDYSFVKELFRDDKTIKIVTADGAINDYKIITANELGHLDSSIQFDYFHVPRDLDAENKLYEGIAEKNYIFVYDENNEFDFLRGERKNMYVYRPNGTENFLHYAKIIENASEIYVIDSLFFSLSVHLDLIATVRVVKNGDPSIIEGKDRDKWIIKN